MTTRPRTHSRPYRVPALIALASVVGLVSALVGDGVFDALSWLALGTVIGTVGWAIALRSRA